MQHCSYLGCPLVKKMKTYYMTSQIGKVQSFGGNGGTKTKKSRD